MLSQLKLSPLAFLNIAIFGAAALLLVTPQSFANGMTPDAPVVIIDESVGEASIVITNNSQTPNLLVSTIRKLPGDDEDILLLTPPIARVEPGESQLVRFILQSDTPLTTQRLRRVTFQGVPPKNNSATPHIDVTLSQNLPIVISPKGLKRDLEPWKHLKWSIVDGKLSVNNPSAYIVRLSAGVEVLPSAHEVMLPHTHILAGQTLLLDLPAGTKASSVNIQPANLYGYAVAAFNAPIE